MKLLNMFLNVLNASSNVSEVVENIEKTAEGMGWHPEKALDTLPKMGKGMVVIFVIIGVIIISTLIINKIFADKKK